MYKQLAFEITQIDTGLIAPGVAACYLLESEAQVAIIETGNFETTERVLSLLEQRNLPRENVRFVIPTHVHLDHAGGASSLMDALPNAELVIHPRGARHMFDPSKLIAGAKVVYGEEKFKALYGDIKPIAEARTIIAEDNSSLLVGNRKLVFRDTPGHASHHFCVWDELSAGWFTGDTFGIAYPRLSNTDKPFLFPTTTPVQFDPELLLSSIELMISYSPKRMYLTHFGCIDVDRSISDKLCHQIKDYVNWIESQPEQDITQESIKLWLIDYTYQLLMQHGSTISMDKFVKIMAMDFELNSQGLLIWHQRKLAKQQASLVKILD